MKNGINVTYSLLKMMISILNLPIEYSDKAVTPFGGMSLMKRFVDQVGIRVFLRDLDLPRPGSNRGYDPAEIVEFFWLSI